MENTTIKDVILDKKIADYNFDRKDYIAAGEITVTITLGEYRKLIADCATAEKRISEANSDKYERETECKNLKEENDRLKAELYELTKKFDDRCEESDSELVSDPESQQDCV